MMNQQKSVLSASRVQIRRESFPQQQQQVVNPGAATDPQKSTNAQKNGSTVGPKIIQKVSKKEGSTLSSKQLMKQAISEQKDLAGPSHNGQIVNGSASHSQANQKIQTPQIQQKTMTIKSVTQHGSSIDQQEHSKTVVGGIAVSRTSRPVVKKYEIVNFDLLKGGEGGDFSYSQQSLNPTNKPKSQRIANATPSIPPTEQVQLRHTTAGKGGQPIAIDISSPYSSTISNTAAIIHGINTHQSNLIKKVVIDQSVSVNSQLKAMFQERAISSEVINSQIVKVSTKKKKDSHTSGATQGKLIVQKSSSQKSINREGTPQNQTNRSLKNKHVAVITSNNTASKALMDSAATSNMVMASYNGSGGSQNSMFSQQQHGAFNYGVTPMPKQSEPLILSSSSKKNLMPSSSSSKNLFKKQILELDEAKSSSSSSIGREEYANQAFNGSTGEHKMKNQLFQHQEKQSNNEVVPKNRLNFSEKPFADEVNPFAQSMTSAGAHMLDLDDDSSIIEQYQIHIPTSKLQDVRLSGQFGEHSNIKQKQKVDRVIADTIVRQFHNKSHESSNEDTVIIDSTRAPLMNGIKFDVLTSNSLTVDQMTRAVDGMKSVATMKSMSSNNQPKNVTSMSPIFVKSKAVSRALPLVNPSLPKSSLSIHEEAGRSSLGAIQQKEAPLKIKIQKASVARGSTMGGGISIKLGGTTGQDDKNYRNLDTFAAFGDLVQNEVLKKNQNTAVPNKSGMASQKNQDYIVVSRPGNVAQTNFEKYEKPQISPRLSQKLGELPEKSYSNNNITGGEPRQKESIYDDQSNSMVNVTNELKTASDKPQMVTSAIKSQHPNLAYYQSNTGYSSKSPEGGGKHFVKNSRFADAIESFIPFQGGSTFIPQGIERKFMKTQEMHGLSLLVSSIIPHAEKPAPQHIKQQSQIDLSANQHQLKHAVHHSRQATASIQLPRNFSQTDGQSADLINLQQQHSATLRASGLAAALEKRAMAQTQLQKNRKQHQQSLVHTIDPSSICRLEDFEEGKFSSPKSIQSQLQMTLKSQTQAMQKGFSQLIKGIVSKKSKFEKAPDEFNALAVEDDVNEERAAAQKNEGLINKLNKQQKLIDQKMTNGSPNIGQVKGLHQATVVKSSNGNMVEGGSPSISNKIPNSIAFKMKNHTEEEFNAYSQSKSPEEKRIKLFLASGEDFGHNAKQQLFFDDENPLSTRRMGTAGDLVNYSLRDKDELNRNIPQAKQYFMDFRGIQQVKNSSPNQIFGKAMTPASSKYPQLIQSRESLGTVVLFLDFENLLKLMSINKLFREEANNRPSRYQMDIQKIFKAQQKRLLIAGLSSTLQRIQYWNFKTKFFYGKKKKPNLYRQLKRLKTNEGVVTEIRKDVNRTFPDMSFFQLPQRGQERLFNVLNALAQNNVSIGYIQGMNFLAGTILINLQRGEETFWMMMSILYKYKFGKVLDLRNGGQFQVLCFQLEILMQTYLPKLEEHLRALKIPTDIYAANWFITMFCYELSLDLVFCILDVFLLEGVKSLLKVSLALLKFMEPQLLQMTHDECMVYLSHCQKELEIDSQTLLKEAFGFKVTNSLLKELEVYYSLRKSSFTVATGAESPEEIRQIMYFRAFNRMQLEFDVKKIYIMGKEQELRRHYWVMLPATPEDMQEVIRRCKHKKIGLHDISEEDMLIFYQQHLQHRRLSDIIAQFQYPNQEADETNDLSVSRMASLNLKEGGGGGVHSRRGSATNDQKKNRRKALSTVFSDLDQVASEVKKNINMLNTIQEQYSNDEYSRGGYSSHKPKVNSPTTKGITPQNHYLSRQNPKIGHGAVASSIDQLSPSQMTSEIDYRSIQVSHHKSVIGLMPDSGLPQNETPKQKFKAQIKNLVNEVNNNQQRRDVPMSSSLVAKSSESPFEQLGSRIKNIFGNFFKVDEKMNKSYEELNAGDENTLYSYRDAEPFAVDEKVGNVLKRNSRSKSIYNSLIPGQVMASPGRGIQQLPNPSDILILDNFNEGNHASSTTSGWDYRTQQHISDHYAPTDQPNMKRIDNRKQSQAPTIITPFEGKSGLSKKLDHDANVSEIAFKNKRTQQPKYPDSSSVPPRHHPPTHTNLQLPRKEPQQQPIGAADQHSKLKQGGPTSIHINESIINNLMSHSKSTTAAKEAFFEAANAKKRLQMFPSAATATVQPKQQQKQPMMVIEAKRKRSEDYEDEEDGDDQDEGDLREFELINDSNEGHEAVNSSLWQIRQGGGKKPIAKIESPDVLVHKKKLFSEVRHQQQPPLGSVNSANRSPLLALKKQAHESIQPRHQQMPEAPGKIRVNLMNYNNDYDYDEEDDGAAKIYEDDDECEVEKLSSELDETHDNQSHMKSMLQGGGGRASGIGIVSSNVTVSRRHQLAAS